MFPEHYIFNHIPKTGGVSLLTICRQNLAESEISPHLTEAVRLIQATRFERYKLVAGHFSLLIQAGFSRSRYSMTMLRDPIRRILSSYVYWRTAAEENPVTAKAKETSFAEFVRYFQDSPSIINNTYTYHFAAIGRDSSAYGLDPAALLAAAKHNLAAFDFIGICEQFEATARRLCEELGWPPPENIPHENRSGSEDALASIDRKTQEILCERTRLDTELYAYGVSLFQSRGARSRAVERNRLVQFPRPYTVDRRARIETTRAAWTGDSRLLEITVRFRVQAPVDELSLGVEVSDAAGRIVWGTSTANERLEFPYKTGYAFKAAFRVQCELPTGVYFVTVALSEPRRLGFHDHWIDRATRFTVDRERVAYSRYVRGMMLQSFHCAAEP